VRDSLVGALKNLHRSIPVTVEEALAEAKASGLFDGPQGPPGETVPIDDAPREGSENAVSSGAVYSALQNVQTALSIDAVPTQDSPNPVSSGGVHAALADVQDSIVQAASSLRKPDWNENDTESGGYIRNRPFYEELVWDPLYNGETTSGASLVSFRGPIYRALYEDWTEKNFGISFGKSYRVRIDGEDYYAEARPAATYYTALNSPCIFIPDVLLIVSWDKRVSYCYHYRPSTTIHVEVYEQKTAVHPLDNRFLQIDSEPAKNSGNSVSSGGVYTKLQQLSEGTAPGFLDDKQASELSSIGSYDEQARILIACSSMYYQISLSTLLCYIIQTRSNPFSTIDQTIQGAVNELYDDYLSLRNQEARQSSQIDELRETVRNLSRTVEEQGSYIRQLQARVAVLESFHENEPESEPSVEIDADGIVHMTGLTMDSDGVVHLTGAVFSEDGVVRFSEGSVPAVMPTATINANGEVTITCATMDSDGVVHLTGAVFSEDGVVRFGSTGTDASLSESGVVSLSGAGWSDGVARFTGCRVDEDGVVRFGSTAQEAALSQNGTASLPDTGISGSGIVTMPNASVDAEGVVRTV
jgi:hypothetical protein